MYLKKRISTIIIFFCLLILPAVSNSLIAQPLPPTGHHGNTANQPAGAPLDGGLSLFLLLGAAYGGKKIRKLKIRN